MNKPITLADVAAAAGVSMATASRALASGPMPRCAARTAARVRETATRLGYQPLKQPGRAQLRREIGELHAALDAIRADGDQAKATRADLVQHNLRLNAEASHLRQQVASLESTVVALRDQLAQLNPRTWTAGDRQPAHVTRVRDRAGRIWTPTVQTGWWINGDTAMHWKHLVADRGPLTEMSSRRNRGRT